MPDKPPEPIESLDAHRRALDELMDRIGDDPRALALARDIGELLQFEQAHDLVPSERFMNRLAAPRGARSGRTALICDIHGNHAGLLVALSDIVDQRCDRIVCLGDLVDGGPDDDKVVDTIATENIPCVRGNHDEVNDVELSAQSRKFLLGLPERLIDDDVLYVHISPRPINRKINHVVEAWNVFDESTYWTVFVGHAHVPYIFSERSTTYGQATQQTFAYNQPFELSSKDRYIVSVGSIGYGRDNVGKVRYAIFDRKAGSVEHRAIDGPLLPMDRSFAVSPALGVAAHAPSDDTGAGRPRSGPGR